MKALLKSIINLEDKARVVNNGRTDSVYFYVNGNNVSVSSPFFEMTEDQQKNELDWFLNGYEFEIN